MLKCNNCGDDMVFHNEGAESFEKWWTCPNCGNEVSQEDIDNGFWEEWVDELDDDNDDSERISVHDAANIYLSKGFDEDYRFGYSHEELIKALK